MAFSNSVRSLLKGQSLGPMEGETVSLLLLFNQPLPWHKVLLETAKRLQREKHHEVAVVASMMACETASERAFTHFFEARGLTEFREPIEGFFASYSLANDRVRKFYIALSGDSIHESPFWARFKESVRVRNAVVHDGARATADEAVAAVTVSTEFVEHISQVMTPIE